MKTQKYPIQLITKRDRPFKRGKTKTFRGSTPKPRKGFKASWGYAGRDFTFNGSPKKRKKTKSKLKEATKTKQYIELIRSWNKTHNLVSQSQEQNLDHHIEDSLSVFEGVGRAVVDLGSGGGLPGIPLAIKGPEKEVVLVESNSKKASFLLNTINKLGLKNARVINARIEDIDPAALPKNYEIIARAVGSTEKLVKLTKKHLDQPGTKLKLMKTEDQLNGETLPPGYAIKKTLKIPSKGKDKGRILVTIEKDG